METYSGTEAPLNRVTIPRKPVQPLVRMVILSLAVIFVVLIANASTPDSHPHNKIVFTH